MGPRGTPPLKKSARSSVAEVFAFLGHARGFSPVVCLFGDKPSRGFVRVTSLRLRR